MEKLLTICANKKINNSILEFLNDHFEIKQKIVRNDKVWDLTCSAKSQLTSIVKEFFYIQEIDFALQSANKPERKLLMSDMDATVVVGETIDDIAEILGVGDQISKITEQAMLGKINYHEAIDKRLELLKGTPKDKIIEIARKVNFASGAREMMNEINARKIDSFLISGGFTIFTDIVSEELGFRQHLSNELGFDENDLLNGHFLGGLVTAETKLETLEYLIETQNIEPEQTVAVGDGANDLYMLNHAGLGVAYRGKPIVRKSVDAEIHSGGLDNLIWFL